MQAEISLTLLTGTDTPDGCIRLDAVDMRALGAASGDVVCASGARRSFLRLLPAFMEDRNQNVARVSEQAARNIGYLQGRSIKVSFDRLKPPLAELVTLETVDALDELHLLVRQEQLPALWRGRIVTSGDEITLPSLDVHSLAVRVHRTQPAGAVAIGHATVFSVKETPQKPDLPPLGGLRDLDITCRDLCRARFKKAGKTGSVLLSGPPGCGKATLVKRLAKETDAALHIFDCYELMDQFLAHGSTELGPSLFEIARRGKTIILIDHLEALDRELSPHFPAQAAFAVTAQVCAALEEVKLQPEAMLFTATAGPVPARLLKDGLFDARFYVDLPNRWARHEVLLLARRDKKSGSDVDLAALSALSGGMSARDLNALMDAAAIAAQGDLLSQEDLVDALRSFSPSDERVRCDVPTSLWNDIAGLEEVKSVLLETLSWSLHEYGYFAANGVQPPRSILLSGGHGTGKTTLVRALAGFVPMNFIETDSRLLAARAPREGRDYLRDVFSLARRKAPCMIFFDDIDALFEGAPAPEDAAIAHPVVAQLTAELDAMAQLPGVVVIAATSRPDRLTNDFLRAGRFDFALALPLPDAAARKKILHARVEKMPLAADIDFDQIAAMTHGLSPADLANLCNRVGLMAFRRSLAGDGKGVIPPVVNAELFEQALRGKARAEDKP